MKIAFHILRMTWYRLLAPCIDKALDMGWHVECWHNTSNPSIGAQMPKPNSVPSFRTGRPIIREYQGWQGLLNLVQKNSVDAIVDIYPPLVKDSMGRDPEVFRNIDRWPSRPNRPFWIVLEGPPGDSYNGVRCDEQLMNCDLFAVKTEFWANYYCHSRSVSLKHVADYIKKNPKIFGKFQKVKRLRTSSRFWVLSLNHALSPSNISYDVNASKQSYNEAFCFGISKSSMK